MNSDIRGKIPQNGFGFIYKYECLGKVYIGQTIASLSARHYNHLHGSQYIDNVIRKHPYKLTIIYTCPIDELDMMEKIFIREYNSLYPNGYNLNIGGHLPKYYDYNTLSQSLKGRFLKERNPFYGKKHSVNSRNKMSESSDRKYPVYQYDLYTHRFIKKWGSKNEVELHTGIHHSNIAKCCEGKVKSAGGYFWSYKSDLIEGDYYPIQMYDSMSKSYLKSYKSVSDAEKDLNIDRHRICEVLNHKRESYMGYIWCWNSRSYLYI